MKTKVSRKSKQSGAALLTALILCTVLSLVVMYYLSLTQQQTLLSARSQTWNTAIAVTEAGLEEGLQQLNDNTANLTADGWSFNGTVYQSPVRTFPDGSYYVSVIDMSADPFNPGVLALAHQTPPHFAYNGPAAFFADIGGSSATPPVSRAVVVRCTRGNLLIKGMVAKHLIDMNGNDILTDSFDSTDPAKNTAGHYDTNKFVGDNGDVATNERVANSVGVNNANIYGHVIVGKGGSVAVGPNGAVGEHSWQPANLGSVETGYFNDNANFTFPDQWLPYNSGKYPAAGLADVTTYSLSTNAVVGSPVYPNPVPPDGVTTNTIVKTVNSWPNQANTITNCGATITKSKDYPAAGTYCGSPWQTGNDVNWWYYYNIANYTYTSQTYSYNLYVTNSSLTTTAFDHILYDGDYYYNDSTLGGFMSHTWLVVGNARLVLPKGISMAGTDVLQIAPGGSLQLFAAGKTDTIGGNGIINQNGFAVNCQLNFTPATTTLNFNGNGEFIGTIVAPEANVNMNGGGHSNNDFIGALMANSITMNGHYSFHYDEALGKRGANSRFIITSWNEVDPSTLPSGYFSSSN